jgi:hypothetical protein
MEVIDLEFFPGRPGREEPVDNPRLDGLHAVFIGLHDEPAFYLPKRKQRLLIPRSILGEAEDVVNE